MDGEDRDPFDDGDLDAERADSRSGSEERDRLDRLWDRLDLLGDLDDLSGGGTAGFATGVEILTDLSFRGPNGSVELFEPARDISEGFEDFGDLI